MHAFPYPMHIAHGITVVKFIYASRVPRIKVYDNEIQD